MTIGNEPFGKHLMLDFYGCDPKKLENMEICYDSLKNLPPLLKMRNLAPPFVIEAESNEHIGGKDPGGFTGFVLIAESHISLHSFPRRGFLTIDVYSCKDFNEKEAIKYFEDIFLPKSKEVNLINRGSYYPKESLY